MQLQSEAYVKSEQAFATWYESTLAPNMSGLELRLVDLLGEMQSCENYIIRRESRWPILDHHRRRKIGEKQTRLVQLRAEKSRTERILEALRKNDSYERGRAMFARICAIPRVTSVTYGNKKLTVYTDRLYCYGASPTGSVWYRLCKYAIEINLEQPKTGWVRWKTSELERPPNFVAPQIPASGVVTCFGLEAQTRFDIALAINEYDIVVNVLVRFTECPTTSENMKGWPIVERSEVPQWYLETPLVWRSS